MFYRTPDCLSEPELCDANIARLKRLMDALGFTGPITIAGDCTKVRQRLNYSNDFGGHVLGSVLPRAECAVSSPDDIARVITQVNDENLHATQTRATLALVRFSLQYTRITSTLLRTQDRKAACKMW